MKRCNRPFTIRPCDCEKYSEELEEWACDENYGECEHQGEEIIENESSKVYRSI